MTSDQLNSTMLNIAVIIIVFCIGMVFLTARKKSQAKKDSEKK